MRVLLLDYKQYSKENILRLENNFTEVYKKNFSNILGLKRFLRDKKESKNISQREKVGLIIELEEPAKENSV